MESVPEKSKEKIFRHTKRTLKMEKNLLKLAHCIYFEQLSKARFLLASAPLMWEDHHGVQVALKTVGRVNSQDIDFSRKFEQSKASSREGVC